MKRKHNEISERAGVLPRLPDDMWSHGILPFADDESIATVHGLSKSFFAWTTEEFKIRIQRLIRSLEPAVKQKWMPTAEQLILRVQPSDMLWLIRWRRKNPFLTSRCAQKVAHLKDSDMQCMKSDFRKIFQRGKSFAFYAIEKVMYMTWARYGTKQAFLDRLAAEREALRLQRQAEALRRKQWEDEAPQRLAAWQQLERERAEQEAKMPERRRRLLAALRARGLVLRADSKLCAQYIQTGKGRHDRPVVDESVTVSDIAQRMCEVRFLFDHCHIQGYFQFYRGNDDDDDDDHDDRPCFEDIEQMIVARLPDQKYPDIFPWENGWPE